MTLTRDSLLVRAPEITLHLHSSGAATATIDGKETEVGLHALAILTACSESRRLGDLADDASVNSGRDFVDFVATALHLVERGLLKTLDDRNTLEDTRGQWNDPGIQARMLSDATRTKAFVDAVRATVRPGDVVIDIGSGTGILAIAAAQAGARKVYAIEATTMADMAHEMMKGNGVDDRVEVLQAWSSRVSLADRADVLVTETIGDDPLDEHIIDITRDAHKRLLHPGARIIPQELRLFISLIQLPPELEDRFTFSQRNLDTWTGAYGIDFRALQNKTLARRFPATLRPHEARQVIELSEPVEIGRVFLDAPVTPRECRVELEATRPGTLHGVLLWFEVGLTDTISITTRPSVAPTDNHWRSTLWVEPRPFALEPGRKVYVRSRPTAGGSQLDIEP